MEKFVLCQNNQMRAVVVSLDTFARLHATESVSGVAQAV